MIKKVEIKINFVSLSYVAIGVKPINVGRVDVKKSWLSYEEKVG